MQCCNIYDSYPSFQDGLKEMITLSLEEKVMQQKYKVLSFAIVAALYIFLVPSPSHAQMHVPNTLAGAKVCGGPGWTLGCDRIPLNGQPGTATTCENLFNQRSNSEWGWWGVYDTIQATGGYCYYYKAGTSSGRGGPNMWSYVEDPACREANSNCTRNAAGRMNQN